MSVFIRAMSTEIAGSRTAAAIAANQKGGGGRGRDNGVRSTTAMAVFRTWLSIGNYLPRQPERRSFERNCSVTGATYTSSHRLAFNFLHSSPFPGAPWRTGSRYGTGDRYSAILGLREREREKRNRNR